MWPPEVLAMSTGQPSRLPEEQRWLELILALTLPPFSVSLFRYTAPLSSLSLFLLQLLILQCNLHVALYCLFSHTSVTLIDR